MTSLFHFEDKIHRRNLTRVNSIPLMFLRLLCQMLEQIGFPAEPQLEHRRDCETILSVNRSQLLPRTQHLPPKDIVEYIKVYHPVKDTEEP